MAEGYFNDGTVDIELGEHVFASPSARRRIVTLDPHSAPAAVLDSGGGILDLEVTAQRLRENLGDAERYVYEILRALATSEPGDLGFEDNRGHRHVFGDSVCIGGSGEVQAYRFVDMRLDFLTPEKQTEPAWGAVPAAPAAYPGTWTLQNYSACGVSLGVGGSMEIRMGRHYPLREIPRARGSREGAPESRAHMRFVVQAAVVADVQNLATALENLERQIAGELTLVANGNAYAGCILEAMRPRHTDRKHTMVEYRFVQEIDLSADGIVGWTTAAPTTTTTTTI